MTDTKKKTAQTEYPKTRLGIWWYFTKSKIKHYGFSVYVKFEIIRIYFYYTFAFEKKFKKVKVNVNRWLEVFDCKETKERQRQRQRQLRKLAGIK